MHIHAQLYAIYPELTIGQIKKNQIPTVDQQTQQDFLKWSKKRQIDAIVQDNELYHHKLLSVPSKPYIVYYQGDINILHMPLLAIVGPRKPSAYAESLLQQLFTLLPQYHLATISGMADGVDHIVHQLSMDNNIPTVAVLGGGIVHYLQSSHASFIQKIIQHKGLVVSEFKPTYTPTNFSFPQRNRIVAGLADIVYIPEASEKSGSLITADFALQAHKQVFGTPNSIFSPHSAGLHQYMQDKKISPVCDMQKWLDQYFVRNNNTQQTNIVNISPQEQNVVDIIAQRQGCTMYDIVHHIGVDTGTVMLLLTNLEMNGLIKEDTPGTYILTQNIAKN